MRYQPVMIRICFCLMISAMTLHASGPGTSNDFQGRRVLIIGIDGLLPDALQAAETPNLRKLMKHGITTWTAVSGGALGGTTQQPTLSGPGWTSMLTGKYIDVHGVAGNATTAYDTPGSYQVTAAPHFARRLKESHPSAAFASIVSWGWIEDYLVAAQPGSFEFHAKGEGSDYPGRDLDVCRKAVSYLGSSDPDVLFVHFDQVDGMGHATGFSKGNPEYIQAIGVVDGHVGELMGALAARPRAEKEDWMIIVTSDHGGTTGGAHGGQSPEERTIPLIASGKTFAKDRVETSTPGLHVIPAMTFRHLGIKIDPAWGWQPGDFGFGGE